MVVGAHGSDSGDGPGDSRVEYGFGAGDLACLRVLVEEFASRAGLAEHRRADLVLAVSEIASNAIEHAGGGGHLTIRTVEDRLECRIADAGPGFSAKDVPEPPPDGGRPRGHGLWMARLITDHLSIAAETVGAVVTLAVRMT